MAGALEKVVAVHSAQVALSQEGDSYEEAARRNSGAVELAVAGRQSLAEAAALIRAGQGVPADLILSASLALEGFTSILDITPYDWVEATAFDPHAVDMAGDGSKPYGDVEYADPGYQADGKKRYPVDTPEHARAAWSYINQGKNAGQYSSKQLASIKAKIKSAAKGHGIDISDDGDADDKKVAASMVLLAAQTPMLEMASIKHKPLMGLHGHAHTHFMDNHHGPARHLPMSLARGAGVVSDIQAHQHPNFHGTHDHPHLHHNDSDHGMDHRLVAETQGKTDSSWGY